jgi:FixJ family two-component response regulator
MPALDLLVTDLSMPGMRGSDLARSLLARHPAIAVLCMSGFAGQDATDEWPILQKPFAPEALLEAVRRLRPLV